MVWWPIGEGCHVRIGTVHLDEREDFLVRGVRDPRTIGVVYYPHERAWTAT
jgi:hypothetical protein